MMLDPTTVPGFLTREIDAVTPVSVLETGDRLGLPHLPIWHFAAENVEVLKTAFRSIPETLNYNDFHWTNLALSRGEPVRAIVFDYHLLGIGPCHCDVRNVCGSLGGRAREAFLAAYGPVDPRVAVLDAPLAVLFSLGEGSLRESLPTWADPCLRGAVDGGLERDIRAALAQIGK
jgi:hypothetical protein